jgi:hypothetical protein
MATISGVVAVVQEGRFQLALDDGSRRIFVLGHNAPAEPDQLAALQKKQSRVAVAYRPLDKLIAAEAQRIAETPVLSRKTK